MSWTNAVITDAGHALQAALLGTGKGLVFTRAVSGAGLAAGDLAAQTAVTDARQELTMQPAAPLEDAKTRVQAMLSNAGLEAGYTMHQLGFYAKAQDSADEILYALVQDEAGDPIPAAAENPGFTADWTYIFAYGSADSVTVTVDPAGVVPWSAVGAPGGVAPLDESGKVPAVHLRAMGGSLLTITFDEMFAGFPYTLTGGAESYADTVPESLHAVHSLLAVNTAYTLTVQYGSGSKAFQVTTADYFTALALTADRAEYINVPTVSGALTYTGLPQSPVWEGLNEYTMTISGDTAATDAGTYTAAFTPKPGFRWTDYTDTEKRVQWTIARAELAVPKVSSNPTYNGNTRSPSWSGYDAAKMTIGGTTSAKNAGTYTATFTPKANYQWPDGSQTAKSVNWSILKATPTLTVSPSSLSLSASTSPQTAAITYNGDGSLSAVSSKTGVATVSLSGKTLSVTAAGDGTATITVRASAGTNYSSRSVTLSVSVDMYDFATDSWETIAAISEAGRAAEVYSLGDTKDIELTGIGTMTLEIADFNHDYLSASNSAKKAGMSLLTKNLLPEAIKMNEQRTSAGGYPSSDLCAYLTGTVWNALPSDLQSHVKTIYKTYLSGKTAATVWKGYKIWIPLEYEMFGENTYGNAAEHTTGKPVKYPIFTDNQSRIKKAREDAVSSRYVPGGNYWTATPDATDDYYPYFSDVNFNGSSHYRLPELDSGVCFGICI